MRNDFMSRGISSIFWTATYDAGTCAFGVDDSPHACVLADRVYGLLNSIVNLIFIN